MRDRNINITDRDELAKLRDQQAQRLTREYLDGWNSQEFIDVYSRGFLIVCLAGASFSLWQMFSWNVSIAVVIIMAVMMSIHYLRTRGGNSNITIPGAFYLLWVGFFCGVDLSFVWHRITSLLGGVL